MSRGNELAYPISTENPGVVAAMGYSGMTKREYFTAAAMQGLLANPDFDFDGGCKEYASFALMYADALIAALEARDEK